MKLYCDFINIYYKCISKDFLIIQELNVSDNGIEMQIQRFLLYFLRNLGKSIKCCQNQESLRCAKLEHL
jgi:hypothetical protein